MDGVGWCSLDEAFQACNLQAPLSNEGDRLIDWLSWPIRGRRRTSIIILGIHDVFAGTIASKQLE